MEDDEKIVIIVPNLCLDKIYRTIGDLIFTNRRIIFVKTLRFADFLSMSWISFPFNKAQKKSKKNRSMELKELLKIKLKKEMINYEDIDNIEIVSHILRSSRIVLKCNKNKQYNFFGKRKNISELINVADQLKSLGVSISKK